MKRGTVEGGDPLAKVNNKRSRVFDAVLDLGATAPIDPILLGKETKEKRPFGSGRDPIIFYLETGERWVDLTDATFTYKMKIVKADGGNLTANLPVAPINNFGYANFRWPNFSTFSPSSISIRSTKIRFCRDVGGIEIQTQSLRQRMPTMLGLL